MRQASCFEEKNDGGKESLSCGRRGRAAYQRARRLKSAGHEVVGARDGTSAISTARQELPDLVLLDLGLPAGDGFVVLKRLQMLIQTTTIPVIVVSARDPAGNRDAALKAGAVAYLQKPLETDVLLKVISALLNPTHLPTPPEPRPEAEGSTFNHQGLNSPAAVQPQSPRYKQSPNIDSTPWISRDSSPQESWSEESVPETGHTFSTLSYRE